MAANVTNGYYAICFPNPIGTSGGNIVTSTINLGFNLKAALLPQSCLGISLTVAFSAVASSTLAYYRPATTAPTATITTA